MQRPDAPAATVARSTFRERYEHLFYISEYGGGDWLADVNCWKNVKPSLRPLMNLAELADSLVTDLRERRYLSRADAAVVADAFSSALRNLLESRDA